MVTCTARLLAPKSTRHAQTTSARIKLMALFARLVITTLVSLIAIPAQAEVISLLSSESIEELESVRLAIRHVGTRQSETLDLAILSNDFHVMGTNTSSQYQYVNGRAESWVDYQITLQPKRAGALTIPPIKVGNERTKAMQLEVRKLTESTRAKIAGLIFYEQEFSNDEIYVQSQLLMTRKLFYMDGVQLYGGQPGAPEIDDALVITLGENRNTSGIRNGNSYGVIEQRYAIFPQSSGSLTIPPIQLSASVRLLDRGRASRKAVRVNTDSAQINVLPIPNEFPKDQPWLPALDITLEQKFGTRTTQTIDVGENLSRVIELNVYGNTGAIAPSILTELDAQKFKQYPRPAVIKEDTNGSTLVGIRKEYTDIVALTPGTHMLPGIDIYWWDTEDKAVKQTSIAATVLTIDGKPLPQIDAVTPVIKNPPTAAQSEPLVMRRPLDYRDNVGKFLLGLLLIAVLWRLVLWLNQDKAAASRISQLDTTFSAYQAAIRSEDLLRIRSTLQTYLLIYFNTSQGESWHQFMQSSDWARDYASLLDSAKYSEAAAVRDWDQTLAQLSQKATAALNANEATDSDHLPDLYPQH